MRVGGIDLRHLVRPFRDGAETGRQIAPPAEKKFDIRQLPFDLLADLQLDRLVRRCEPRQRPVIGRAQRRRRGEIELPEIDKPERSAPSSRSAAASA